MNTSLFQKFMLCCVLVSLLPACGWFRSAPHLNQEQHRDDDAEIHTHDANPEDRWSEHDYPSSDNLYRLMGFIAANVDTADHGKPSQADMFISNFSDAYHPLQADSQTLRLLRTFKGSCQVYISADAVSQESRIFVPRMARLLDQMRFDSSSLYYRGQGISGDWLHKGFPAVLPSIKEIPYACIVRQGKLLGMIRWEDRNRLATRLLELLQAR
ncbi:MAG: hypothetical protein KJS92_09545 [Bacteroidetes bacterium]|nr:hypothetical protein [Bacteroidota bacterium]